MTTQQSIEDNYGVQIEKLIAENAALKEKLGIARESLEYCKTIAINGMASHRDCIVGECNNALSRTQPSTDKEG